MPSILGENLAGFRTGTFSGADIRFSVLVFRAFPARREGGHPMATATAPRNEVYLSLLAARAVTSLVHLAGDPSTCSQCVKDGLQDGVRYCQAFRALGSGIFLGSSSEAWSPLRRAVDGDLDASPLEDDVCEESKRIEGFLSGLLSGQQKADIPKLVGAIEFLRKTATQR
jgi:hypothetical protein